jgi:hypothetical protein
VTKTKDAAPEQQTETGDPIPEQVRTWGLSGEPVSWANVNWQPLVASLRAANRGELDAAAVQSVLDATFPDGGYSASDVMLAHPPLATFTIGPGDEDDSINFALDGDADLGLSDAHVTWVFGDGNAATGFPDATHSYAVPGVYEARVEVAVAGSIYSTSQSVEAGGGWPAVVNAVDPTQATIGDPPFQLRVLGDHFTDDTGILFNGVEQATTMVSENELTTNIDLSAATQTGSAPVGVRNSLGDSNFVGFTVNGVAVQAAAFDPGDNTVAAVQDYGDDNPDQRDAVLEAEKAGKNRTTLIDWLEAQGD